MARIRNRTPETVRLLAQGGPEPFEKVAVADEVITVPDAVYLAHEWPESIWDLVDVPKKPDAETETVDEVKERVGDDPALAQEALDAEKARSHPRVTLVAHLQQLIDDAPEG